MSVRETAQQCPQVIAKSTFLCSAAGLGRNRIDLQIYCTDIQQLTLCELCFLFFCATKHWMGPLTKSGSRFDLLTHRARRPAFHFLSSSSSSSSRHVVSTTTVAFVGQTIEREWRQGRRGSTCSQRHSASCSAAATAEGWPCADVHGRTMSYSHRYCRIYWWLTLGDCWPRFVSLMKC